MIDVAKLRFNQTPARIEPMNTPGQPSPDIALSKALAELYGRIDYERQVKVSAKGFRLKNMRELLRRLGNPQSSYPAIHIAGTKGKGSVSTMVGSILTESGYRAGVYTSPHLEKINQRMAIDGQLVSDVRLLDLLTQLRPTIEAMDREAKECNSSTLTFFEITTAATMLYFAQAEVDFAVLEVGLGGRLDSTNVCEPAACVITNISFDHTRQLGKTIDKIAREKAGIIKPNVPVVSGAIKLDASKAIAEIASERSADLYQLGQNFRIESPTEPTDNASASSSFNVTGRLGDRTIDLDGIKLSLPGTHQQTNAALAVAAIRLLDDPKNQITADSIRSGLAQATLPGRTEIVSTSPLVILDIAHNPASMAALAKTLMQEIPPWRAAKRRMILFATSRDKNATAMLTALSGCYDEVWLTEYQTNPRALPLDKLLQCARTIPQAKVPQTKIQSAANPIAAWEAILAESAPDDAICVTGSAFLVAELRPLLVDRASKSG